MSKFFASNKDFLSETLADLTPEPPTNSLHLANTHTTVTRLGLGAIEIRPDTPKDDLHLVFSAAIHGNETAPIEVCNQLVSDIISEQLHVTRPTLFLLGNPASMRIAKRFTEENMNRLFLGKHATPGKPQNLETQRARLLEQWLDQFLNQSGETATHILHYDLHTAIRPSHRERFALYPFVPNRTPPKQQLALMKAANVDTVLLQGQPAGTFSAHTSVKYGAQSMTIELGSVKPFGQNDLSRYQGIKDLLRTLLKGEESQINESQAEQVDVFEVCHEIINTGNDFKLNVTEDVWNFTPFKAGEVLWKDKQQSYQVQGDDEYIVFPNSKVPKGQRAGLMLRKKA